MRASLLAAAALPLAAQAQQSAWGQCGGYSWQGPTSCISGYYCNVINSYYAQCIPGTASTTAQAPPSSSSTAPSQTVSSGTKTSTASDPPPTGSGPGTVLQSGYYWIRAVAAPNFHKYLQTNPQYTTGTAIMDDYTKAGQFQVVGDQLVELVGGGSLLYANVKPAASADDKKLAVTFEKTKNSYGAFAFSGDALTWSVSSISRPNNAAWLVCANQQLFINLGSYGYMTPAGCADQTIHYYNDKTANS